MIALTEEVGTAGNTDLRGTPPIRELLLRIQGEYHEMPGLSLTAPPAERRWGLDSSTCAFVMTTLIERRILRRTALGTYVLEGEQGKAPDMVSAVVTAKARRSSPDSSGTSISPSATQNTLSDGPQ